MPKSEPGPTFITVSPLRADEREGVAILVVRGDQVLVGLRASARGFGMWALPGGKLDAGETWLDTAVRELAEETGMSGTALGVIGEVRAVWGEGERWRTVYVLVEASGEPAVLEPDKCSQWRWVRELPEPLFPPLAAMVDSGRLSDWLHTG